MNENMRNCFFDETPRKARINNKLLHMKFSKAVTI